MRTTARIAALSVPMFLSSLAPLSFGQAAKESKAQRLENLRTVLTQENLTIAELQGLKSNSSGPHADEVELVIKSRDSVQRLINVIEGKDEQAGIAAHHKHDAESAKSATDYYAAIKQVRQQVEDNYGLLGKDPGNKNNNPTLKNAMKFLGDAHEPIVKEVTDYERAHPVVTAAPAAPAPAAPAPAAPMPPAAAAPVAPAVPAGPDSRVPELNNTISHLDHSIDYITAQPVSDPMRQQTLTAVVKARDTVRQLVDELTGKDVTKDLASDHARDTAAHNGKLPDYYTGLIQVEEYLQNDHTVLGREADDPGHLHAVAIKAIEDAYGLVRQQIDAYHKAHPGK